VTPVPLDLPLRPTEAAELATLIFDHAERKPLTDELRGRLAARAAALKLETIAPWFGSLERDPVHPSAYYLAVDGIDAAPHLLYIALATAPTSSVFHKPLLIGRMRRANGPEVVINAILFSATDREHLDRFAARINPAFLPRPQGSRTEIAVAGDPSAAFEVFHAIHKRTRKNVAAIVGEYHAALWAAIRAGWRHGWAAIADLPADATAADIRPQAMCSRFAVAEWGGPPAHPLTERAGGTLHERFEPVLKAAAQVHEQIRQARVALKIAGAFEWEIALPPTSSDDLEFCLSWLKERNRPAQFVAASSTDLFETAQKHQATLSLRSPAPIAKCSVRVHSSEEAALVAQAL
jgi:hypothetical protein